MKRRDAVRRWSLSAVVVLLTVMAGGAARGFDSYPAIFQAYYEGRYPNVVSGQLGQNGGCNVCHFQGQTPTADTDDAYGMAIKARFGSGDLDVILASIEDLDSDGDSVSNIDEIAADTFPGDATSFPPLVATATATLTTRPQTPTPSPSATPTRTVTHTRTPVPSPTTSGNGSCAVQPAAVRLDPRMVLVLALPLLVVLLRRRRR